MSCPYCDDPKGIVIVDGVADPCCDEIVIRGLVPRTLCVYCGKFHHKDAAFCSDKCFHAQMELIAECDQDRGGEPDWDTMDLVYSMDTIDNELMEWYAHAGQFVSNGVEAPSPPQHLEYAVERDALTHDAMLLVHEAQEARWSGEDPIPF